MEHLLCAWPNFKPFTGFHSLSPHDNHLKVSKNYHYPHFTDGEMDSGRVSSPT